jgi:DNA repair exonuclease SbcCD ATPase subunit
LLAGRGFSASALGIGGPRLTDLLYAIAAVSSAVAAVLAWVAKLWWGKEYAAAKQEIIEAKNAQIQALEREIESLKSLTPMKIREYFLSVRQQLEEYNNALQDELNRAKTEIAQRNQELTRLEGLGAEKAAEVQQLKQERDRLREVSGNLEKEVTKVRSRDERAVLIDMATVKSANDYYAQLRNLLAHGRTEQDVERLSEQLKKYLLFFDRIVIPYDKDFAMRAEVSGERPEKKQGDSDT